MNDSAADLPSSIIHRSFRHPMARAVSAHGVRIVDETGREYLDASGGAAVSCLGHAHPDVLAAMHAQVDHLVYAHTAFFSSEPAEELAAHLVAHAPAGLEHVFFSCGGSEAVEAALKFARQAMMESGQPERSLLVARHSSYHGNTMGALSAGGNLGRRRGFEPWLNEVSRVSACNAYRGHRDGETVDAYTGRLLEELDATFRRLGPQRVLAFVAETVVGASGGAVPPTPGYFCGVRELCDRYGILLIADEVMCGMGRTGTRHAVEQEGIVPDLLVVAKGLGGGYQPIGAMLAHRRLADMIRAGSGAFRHSHTYTGHPMACAAALAVQRIVERDGLLHKVGESGTVLRRLLADALGAHPHVGDIRGRGLLIAVELVADRETKTPFPSSLALHERVKRAAMRHGLLVYPSGGTADGVEGDHVLLAPPFITGIDDLAAIVDRLAYAIDEAIEESQAMRMSSM